MISSQLDGRQLSNLMTTTNGELTRVQNERSNLQLMVDGGKKALKAARNALNDSLIDLAVFKVRAKQVASAERRESGKVFCLKRQRIEFENVSTVLYGVSSHRTYAPLDHSPTSRLYCVPNDFFQATKERMMELNVLRDNHIAKRKTLMDDRSVIMAELNRVNKKIKQYAKRYEIVRDTLGRDEYGEFISPTQLKLQVSEVCEELVHS